MKLPRRLGPGSATPDWVDALDRTAFGDVWGPVADHEVLWVIEPWAFARWALFPAAGEAELVRIAVDPGQRGKGLAKALLDHGCEVLRQGGILSQFLEVRAGNAPARGLYEACGWRQTGLRKGYYRDGEDAILYSLSFR